MQEEEEDFFAWFGQRQMNIQEGLKPIKKSGR